MKVILAEDNKNLGKRGDVAEVAPGFARNFLFPRGLAVLASDGALRDMQGRKAAKSKADDKLLSAARDFGAKIQALELTFSRPAGKDGKLFGSLTAQVIVTTLKEKGIAVAKRQIHFLEPVRSTGLHTVQVKLHPSVVATLRISIEAKK